MANSESLKSQVFRLNSEISDLRSKIYHVLAIFGNLEEAYRAQEDHLGSKGCDDLAFTYKCLAHEISFCKDRVASILKEEE